MDDNKGVYWHQGMFLQPQHFQLADRHHQFQQKPLMEVGLPHFWGVGELDLSAAAITNRVIEVASAKLVFPDHAYVEFPGNAAIAARPFNADWIEGDKPFSVYLGLKKLNRHEPNVSVVSNLADAGLATMRHASLNDPQEVADLYSDGPAAQVRTLLFVVKIFFENELDNLHDYDLIPIARLVRDGDTVKLSENFIAPCYALSGSDTLLRLLKDIRDELAGRARQLQEYKSPREMQKAESDAGHIVFLLALRSLNRFSPILFHLTESRAVHPWHVYGALRQLIGELSSFSERFNMLGEAEDGTPGLPPYDHADLGKCFGRVRSLVSQLLNEITVGPEFLAILEYRDGHYSGLLPRAFFNLRNRFYLVVRSETAPDIMASSLLRDARLAATTEMPQLIAHALPGLELIHMAAAPQGLPRRAHTYYFRIEQISQQWEAVERDGGIALHWLDAPPDLKAEIVVLRR
ncbi:MAG TPA: type VI secretion system baseplate subunit TssK [Burkholderiaceae bacterium]|nr:type VI secretion system baseplate subunit TssK [Burkholderiaceae bacterium]